MSESGQGPSKGIRQRDLLWLGRRRLWVPEPELLHACTPFRCRTWMLPLFVRAFERVLPPGRQTLADKAGSIFHNADLGSGLIVGGKGCYRQLSVNTHYKRAPFLGTPLPRRFGGKWSESRMELGRFLRYGKSIATMSKEKGTSSPTNSAEEAPLYGRF